MLMVIEQRGDEGACRVGRLRPVDAQHYQAIDAIAHFRPGLEVCLRNVDGHAGSKRCRVIDHPCAVPAKGIVLRGIIDQQRVEGWRHRQQVGHWLAPFAKHLAAARLTNDDKAIRQGCGIYRRRICVRKGNRLVVEHRRQQLAIRCLADLCHIARRRAAYDPRGACRRVDTHDLFPRRLCVLRLGETLRPVALAFAHLRGSQAWLMPKSVNGIRVNAHHQ